MPGLPDLPTEILREIFSSLNCVDLAKSCRLSHRLNEIAEPFLYTVADLDSHGIDDMAVSCFLRAVLSRPELAKYVRVLRLSWFSANESNNPNQQNASDINLFATAAAPFGLLHTLSSHGSQIILLLHVLPNLREFYIVPPTACAIFSDFLESTLDIPMAALPIGLKLLRKFGGDWRHDQPAITPTMLLALMMLPSISDIDVHMESTPGDDHETETFDRHSSPRHHRTSTVTKLRFQDSNFSTALLNTILQLPRALTHFTYEDGHPHNVEFESTTFSQALAHLRPTLQYLSLGWIRVLQAAHSADGGEERKTIGCLRWWPVLRTVKCPLTALVGKPVAMTPRLVDVLPVVVAEVEIIRRHSGESSPARQGSQWTVEGTADKVAELVEEMEVCGLRELVSLTVHMELMVFEDLRWVRRIEEETKARLREACIVHGVVGLQVEVY